MIRLDNVSKQYGPDFAVRNVSFHIPRGEIVGLLGHNGAGKTTIMKMLTGYLEPSAGSIKIGDMKISEKMREVQRVIGYLPENCPLYQEMSVIGYLDYCASLRSMPEDIRSLRIGTVLDLINIGNRAFDRIDTLSRGLRQRVGVAQALLHEPEVLILDEPTSGLDPTQIQHMRNLIKNLAPHTTIIISTHIMQEVQATCDRVIIIRDGEKALDEHLQSLRMTRNIGVTLEVDNAGSLFSDIGGIRSVKCVKRGNLYHYTLEVTGNQGLLPPRIVDMVRENNWRLFELAPQIRDLETIFSETMLSSGRIQ